MPAPIVLFAYRRPGHLRRTLASLARCPEIGASKLVVFCDAAKHGAGDAAQAAVREVRRMVRAIDWCGELVVRERERNYGFQNLVLGVGEVLRQHDRAIVLEDDLEVAPGFLAYMNAALELYAADEDVMHVSAYMLPLGEGLPPTLFYNAASCWGWGTWARAWRHFRDAPQEQLEAIARHPRRDLVDCLPYGYMGQLRDNASGRIKTWDSMWHASVFLRGGLCLHPGRSLVNNMGHDGTGENCVETDVFDTQLAREPVAVERIAKREWPGLRQRIARQYDIRPPRLRHRLRDLVAPPLRAVAGKVLGKLVPAIAQLRQSNLARLTDQVTGSQVDAKAKLHSPHRFENSSIGAYSYIAEDAIVKNTAIGRFTSIGPGFRAGFGMHPVDTLSTSPAFYSVHKQCGHTFSANNKVVETAPIRIGSDVYIGMNVTVLDGVTIGDGAVVGAGAVVAQDVPPYGIAVGVPAKVVRWRFDEATIARLLASRWWDGPEELWHQVERHVLDPQAFLAEIERQTPTAEPVREVSTP
jgi:acetyltransferase-like isoleucine patch superfamily enzyme